MFECCQRLDKDREYESDSNFLPLVSARQIDQDIYDSFHTEQQLDLSFNDPRTLVQLQLLETQLENWKRDRPNFGYQLSMFCFP